MSTTDLAPAETVRAAPLLPMNVDQADGAMRAYQELTGRLLVPSDWIGAPGAPGSFVKRSGWQKIATFYAISTEVLERRIERDDEGRPLRAFVLVRATARDGRYADGDGGCATNEPRFASAGGRQKLEHDLPATAATRATNRAISNLVGFGAVSAEEVDAGTVDADVRADGKWMPPEWAADIPDDAIDRFGDNLVAILKAAEVQDPVQVAARDIGDPLVTYCDGVVPAACARLAKLLAAKTAHRLGT